MTLAFDGVPGLALGPAACCQLFLETHLRRMQLHPQSAAELQRINTRFCKWPLDALGAFSRVLPTSETRPSSSHQGPQPGQTPAFCKLGSRDVKLSPVAGLAKPPCTRETQDHCDGRAGEDHEADGTKPKVADGFKATVSILATIAGRQKAGQQNGHWSSLRTTKYDS